MRYAFIIVPQAKRCLISGAHHCGFSDAVFCCILLFYAFIAE